MLQILADIEAAGFIINRVKSAGLTQPTSRFDWIGHSFDLTAGTFSVLAHHETHVLQLCRELLEAPRGRVQSRQLMRLTGKLASASLVLGTVLRLFCFWLHRCAHSVAHPGLYVRLTSEARSEIEFWLSEFASLNSVLLWPPPLEERIVSGRFRSDAGEPGWGAHTEGSEEPAEAHGLWTRAERQRSSTWRELRGFCDALMAFVLLLQSCVVTG